MDDQRDREPVERNESRRRLHPRLVINSHLPPKAVRSLSSPARGTASGTIE
jgi:hypothetical protein